MSEGPTTTCALPTPLERGRPTGPAARTDQAGRLPVLGLLALASTTALILVTELLPVGLLPAMSRDLGVPEGRVGFLATAYAAAALVGAIPLTALTRGRSRRPLLLSLVAGFAAVDVVTAASSSYLLTVGIRLVGGLLGGLVWSMVGGYAARIVPEQQRGRAIAVTMSGATVALAVGVPAGAALAGWVGWRATFGVLGAAAVALLAWIRWAVPAVGGEPSERGSSLRGLLGGGGVRLVLGVTGLLILGHQMAYTFLAPLARASRIDDPGLVLLVFGVSAFGGIWLTGSLVDRHLRGAALSAVGAVTVALALVAASTAGEPGHPAGLVLAVALWGLAFGGAPTLLLTALIRVAGEGNATAANSLQTTVYNLGVAGGSLVGGLVLDRSGVATLPWLAALLTGAALLVVTAARSTLASGRDGAAPRPR
jgi:predicted MFS family arabinose efflux permease